MCPHSLCVPSVCTKGRVCAHATGAHSSASESYGGCTVCPWAGDGQQAQPSRGPSAVQGSWGRVRIGRVIGASGGVGVVGSELSQGAAEEGGVLRGE